MKDMPLVSIVIPVYNGANFMKEAIDSALGQTYKNIEVIVVNDGSRDDGETDRIARSYGDRIVYVQKENGGVSSALNVGIKHMRGEYFSWLSHDDMYSPTKVENQITLLSKFNDPNLIALCGNRQINAKTEFINSGISGKFVENEIISSEEALKSLLNVGPFHGCTLLIPKCVFEKCGGFDERLRYSQDLLMWYKIFLNGYKLVYSGETDVYGRVHNKQLTQTGKEIFYSDSEKVCEMVLDGFISQTTKKYRLVYYFAKYNAKYNVKKVRKTAIAQGKKTKTLKLTERIKLSIWGMYGSIRPTIRKIYYRLFKKVKTQ